MMAPPDYHPASDILAQRIILVTGAADGIGRAAARAFAQHGATVVLLDRAVGALNTVYDEIERAGCPQPAIIHLDLATAGIEAYAAVGQKIEEELGHLDGLLHNAAELGTLTPIELYDLALWARVFSVNVHAPLALTRACLPSLKKSADASIVFTTADVGRHGRAYWGAYGVSCFALEGLMQIWADELETNTRIRVNSLDPGAVRTAMRARAYPGENPQDLRHPEDIMSTYIYLMGPDSAGVTGQAFCAQTATRAR
jgi:NAD(P)-dependent dehydrogenase (short-subunit alcohol dehydrogenase family)